MNRIAIFEGYSSPFGKRKARRTRKAPSKATKAVRNRMKKCAKKCSRGRGKFTVCIKKCLRKK